MSYSSASGLVQRRKKQETSTSNEQNPDENVDIFERNDEEAESKVKLTILEEVVLLGLKDEQGYLSWWNDNISYVLRGCILIELSLRNRIETQKDMKRRPISERLVEVTDKSPTGDVLLDEALKLIATDQQTISGWIDLLSGETWNFLKMGYQLKQVRERIQKGLVDKGVLRTEKQNFLLFDMATHPVSNMNVKEELIKKVIDVLLKRGPAPDKRMISLICSAYAANVLENALQSLPHNQREAAFNRADELIAEYSKFTEKNAKQNTEIMSGVLQVFTKMDSLI